MHSGIRLAFVRIWPQMRHGAGNSTDVTASSVSLKITEALLIRKLRGETTLKVQGMEGFQPSVTAANAPNSTRMKSTRD